MKGKLLGFAALAAVSSAMAGGANAASIDFEELQRGEIIDDQYQDQGVTISAVNNDGDPDVAIVFRAIDFDPTTENDSPDPDLRPPFEGGNLADGEEGEGNPEDVNPGKVLVIARNFTDEDENGLDDSPQGARRGSVSFDFDTPQRSFGFDVIDVDDPNKFTLEFFLADSVPLAVIPFTAFEAGGEFEDGSVVFGDNTINRIDPLTAEELGLVNGFDRVVVNIGLGDGDRAALDRITSVPIPEPGTATLALAGFAGLHMATSRSRRRRHA